MKRIFPASRHKSVIGYTETLGKQILKMEADWIEQLHTQILAFKEKSREKSTKIWSIQAASEFKIL